MFFFIFGFLCGMYVGQELPSVPKLKPNLQMLYDKLFSDGASSEAASSTAANSAAENSAAANSAAKTD